MLGSIRAVTMPDRTYFNRLLSSSSICSSPVDNFPSPPGQHSTPATSRPPTKPAASRIQPRLKVAPFDVKPQTHKQDGDEDDFSLGSPLDYEAVNKVVAEAEQQALLDGAPNSDEVDELLQVGSSGSFWQVIQDGEQQAAAIGEITPNKRKVDGQESAPGLEPIHKRPRFETHCGRIASSLPPQPQASSADALVEENLRSLSLAIQNLRERYLRQIAHLKNQVTRRDERIRDLEKMLRG